MKCSLGFKPFKDYWLNCYFNWVFSLLTSIDPSYRLAAYLNDYHYDVSIWGTELSRMVPGQERTLYTHLRVMPMETFRKEYFYKIFSFEPVNFKEDNDYLEILKNFIRNKKPLQVGVNLYYWLPGSFNWKRNRWSHYSFINGFDEERKIFYVFDEDKYGYNEHEIPEERFKTAIENSDINPHGNIIKIADEITEFKFSINDVINNAKRIIDEIDKFKMSFFWKLTEADFDADIQRDLISVHIFQIINRQKANELLFKEIQKIAGCPGDIDSLVQCSQDLQKGWMIVRSQMGKIYISSRRDEILQSANDGCQRLFLKESEMWKEFLEKGK